MGANRNLHFTIEIATPTGAPAKLRGDLFEALVHAYLSQQSYEILQNVRFTGTEIDLLCNHAVSGRRLIAECKSQRDAVQSAAIDGLFTDVSLHEADEGWLISVGPLGKEAKGKLENIRGRFPGKYSHVSASYLVEQCLRSGYLSDPRTKMQEDQRLSDEVTLILAASGPFWCFERKTEDGTATEGHILVRADTLRQVQQPAVLALISESLDRFADAKWVELSSSTRDSAEPTYTQPIVELTAGSDWTDYRPSRPEDFIGRATAIDDLIGFISKVREDQTSTRIFGVKARSGWGKSSLILKAADQVNRTIPQCYFFAVDCRAAVSSDYGHLAVSRGLANARSRGTEFWGLPAALPFSGAPFEDARVQNGLRALANSRGLVVVVFDQFEEIIHSANRALFARLEQLCYQIDAERLPILLGFSWRTDAMVSADNPGYGMWHKLSDRRYDVELRAFTSVDARIFLDRAEKNAGKKLAAKEKRFLLDNYVGLPWLLKKLTINLLTKSGDIETSEGTSDGAAAIAQLFELDLQELTTDEHACIKSVGEGSPKPLHALNLEFPPELVTGLIEKGYLLTLASK
jgi:hypothetical protein